MSRVLKNRRDVRAAAIQTLYQLIDPPESLTRDDAINFALESGNDPEEGFDEVGDDYFYQLVDGTRAKQEEIDKLIQPYLKGWTLSTIARIDLVVLRVAFYEYFFVDDAIVPKKVAVDEGIEMAKGFSNDQSRKFVSGILLTLLNQEETNA